MLAGNIKVDIVFVEHNETVFGGKIKIPLSMQIRLAEIEEDATPLFGEAQIVEKLRTVDRHHLIYRLEFHD